MIFDVCLFSLFFKITVYIQATFDRMITPKQNYLEGHQMTLFNRTFDQAGKARIAAYEANLANQASTANWLVNEPEEVAVRASGKVHPAIKFADGSIMVCCSCPGSRSGKLNNMARVVGSIDLVNCR